jgi:hypothetical protein
MPKTPGPAPAPARKKDAKKPPRTSPLESLGALGKTLLTLVGKDKKALAAAERIAERGHKELLKGIVEEFKDLPKEARKTLKDLGKLKDDQLDGLEAIRSSLASGALTRTWKKGKIELDWLDFFYNFKLPPRFRNELLGLIGRVRGVIDDGLPEAIGMTLRANPHDIPGSLGFFHAANHLKEKYAGLNPRLRLEQKVWEKSGSGGILREVDIVVSIGQRNLHHEVKTYKNVWISQGFEKQIAKDLIFHRHNNFADLHYLFTPGLGRKLGPVRTRILDIFDSSAFQKELQALGLSAREIAALRQDLVSRLRGDLVGTFEWVSVR